MSRSHDHRRPLPLKLLKDGMLRFSRILATATLMSALTAATAMAAHTKHRAPSKCSLAHERVFTVDTQAIIYEAPAYPEGPSGVFGCARGSKRSYYLGLVPYGGPSGSGGVLPLALVGPVVAYGVGSAFPEHSFHEVWVRNLATGKLLHRMPNGSPPEPGDVGIGDTEAIVVRPDGSVAWIATASDELGGVQVRSVDKTGSHLLAASPEIEPDSLALAGSTLYWTQGGKPMSASLN